MLGQVISESAFDLKGKFKQVVSTRDTLTLTDIALKLGAIFSSVFVSLI